MDKRLYFESLEELSHKDTRVHYYFEYYKTFLNVLRKLKYKLSRKYLKKPYLVYIRPIFEYASEVWDNCGVGNSNKLDQLQLEAARIVTGLPIFDRSWI
jgi:hypothetical protein